MADEPRAEFSVAVFDRHGRYRYVCRFVTAKAAMKTFIDLTGSLEAMLGDYERVIITDGGDRTNVEWESGKGVTYPEDMKERRKWL